MDWKALVKEYKNKVITGKCIDLVPLKPEHFADVVRIRNQERSKYFLNQNIDLTVDMQAKWYEDYLKRDDDIYWALIGKNGVHVGMNRLYDIDGNLGNQGSFIVDENYSLGLPFALEAVVLTLDFAFNTLGLNQIINEDKCDNKMMNSMSKKIGFKFQKETEIRGQKYNYYLLNKDESKLEKYRYILDEFMVNR